jgi:hypothetical protein
MRNAKTGRRYPRAAHPAGRYLAFALPWALLTVFCGTGASKSDQPPAAATSAAGQPSPEAPRFQRGRKMIDAKVVSLQELIKDADRIVHGTVEKVEDKTVTLTEGGQSGPVSVREVTIKVERAMKGNVTDGQSLVVRMDPTLSSPLQQGETIVWYLSADSPLGLTQPVGVFSGDFRVDMKDPERKAINLKQNAGLWEGQLWDEGFESARVQQEAATTLKLPASRRGQLAKVGSETPAITGVPLDFLVSTTLSKVKSQ